MNQASLAHTDQLTTFWVAGHYFGVPVTVVQEVLRFQAVTRVPLAPPVVRGLINLRGQIVTAIDLRRRLGLPDRAPDRRPMNVVLRIDESAVSLLVDEIGEVMEVDHSLFEPPPDTLRSFGRELVRGVYKLPEHLLLVLDAARAIDVDAAKYLETKYAETGAGPRFYDRTTH